LSEVSAPTGWKVAPLADLVEILDGRRVPVNAKERADRIGSVPYYGATGQVGTIDKAIFNEDLVLLGEDGVQFFDPNKLKAYRISGPAWVNNHAHVLRARPEIDWRFLEHYLNQFDYQGYANGTTRLKLTQAAMKGIPVVYPSLDRQRKVVEVLEDYLSRIDAGDELLRRALIRAQRLIASVQDSLVWARNVETVAVGELLREKMRNGHSARAVQDDVGGIRTLTLTAVTLNSFTDNYTKITTADPGKVAGLWLKSGDILVQRANTPDLVGTSAIYEGPEDWAIYPDLLIRLRVDEALARPHYVALALAAERTHRALRSRAKGLAGSMPKVDQSAIAATRIPLPSLEEQDRTVQEAKAMRSSTTALSHELERAARRSRNLRRALLTAAFNGKLTGSESEVMRIEEMADV
jgi:type I restriction enzyme, S subunit